MCENYLTTHGWHDRGLLLYEGLILTYEKISVLLFAKGIFGCLDLLNNVLIIKTMRLKVTVRIYLTVEQTKIKSQV